MNWLDVLLIAVAVAAALVGLFKGLVREVVGLAAVVLGLILAAAYYPDVARALLGRVSNLLLAYFLAFLIIFFAVATAGWVAGLLLSKLMKGPLALANHLLGGMFGLVKGVVVGGVIVLALVSFGIGSRALQHSRFGPAALQVAAGIVHIIPRELRARFRESYGRIRVGGGGYDRKI